MKHANVHHHLCCYARSSHMPPQESNKCVGAPWCAFRQPPVHSSVQVPLFVLDDHAQQEAVDEVDILTIKTDGHDPLVLEGAMEMLPKRVAYVEFQYHRLGIWAQVKLEDVLQKLHGFGFVCYWLGRKKLWRLTGCWQPDYEIKRWSNVGCVHPRRTEWYEIMEDIFRKTVGEDFFTEDMAV